jgi:hypothetical protein
MNRIFVGFDDRQPITYSVYMLSLMAQAQKEPISVSPLVLDALPITRRGLTPFTFSRFLVPWLCDYEGWALFTDADMLAEGDINDIFALADDQYAVMTVNTNPAFERAAVMLFNCSHPDNKKLTPVFVENCDVPLHKIGWTKAVGELPPEWNHLVLYDEPTENPRLIHFTCGAPCYPGMTDRVPYAERWREWSNMSNSIIPYEHLMEPSKHHQRTIAYNRWLDSNSDLTFNDYFESLKSNAA